MRKAMIRSAVFLFLFLFSLTTLFAQNTTIRGVVRDPNGLPLQGASVTVEGSKRGVVTDANGRYSISVPPGNYTIVITYVGMQQQKQTVEVPQGGLSDVSFSLQSGGDLNRIVIVGSRSATVRSSTQTVAPVDVISVRDLQATGQVEPTQMLNMIAPSFNSSRQTVADGTDHIDPATLRGLGPDQVLVLVNGKRRYNTALLNVNGTIGRGSVGTDLNSIPPEAIERIEVLRDGASSQYGSDAIAGVVNVVLKKNNRGTTLYSHYGKYYAGDGENYQVGLTQGLKLGDKGGFLTLSGDFRHREPTNRVGDYRGRVYVSDSLQDEAIMAQRGFSRKNNMAIGQSELDNLGFVVNGGVPFSATTQLFFTGSINWRDGKAAGFYRYPNQTSQVIAELYPNGFLPYINSEINDKSAIVGVEGKAGRWNWDASQTAGGNSFAFSITNTNNASQFAMGANAPTAFEAGQLKFYQYVTNVNFSRDFGTSVGLKSFNLATGAELRFDNYQIVEGEEASYKNYAPTSGRVGGAQVFPGFQPVNAVNETRTVTAVYADLETDLSDRLLANAAARFENYSDFGSNVAGKLALRFKITDALSLRGSFSNGFRAPSMHQRYFSSVATVFISNGTTLVPVQNGTFNNESEVAKAFGMPSLKAEKSLNYSAGITSRFGGFNLTVDGYIVKITDRIVLTGSFTKSSPVVAQLLSNYPDVNSVAFFTNAIDTRTKGIDIVLSRNARLGKATLTGSLAANFNETEVTESRPLPDQLKSDPTLAAGVLFDREQKGRIERGQPRDKVTLGLTYNIERFTVNTRVTRFGKVASSDRVNPLLDESFDPRIVTDLSVGYRIGNFATLTIGANNIANVYPEKLEKYGNTSLGRFIYSRSATQFGFNGGYYYSSLVFDLSNLKK
jgi:iron complex outermembrane recepter protein